MGCLAAVVHQADIIHKLFITKALPTLYPSPSTAYPSQRQTYHERKWRQMKDWSGELKMMFWSMLRRDGDLRVDNILNEI